MVIVTNSIFWDISYGYTVRFGLDWSRINDFEWFIEGFGQLCGIFSGNTLRSICSHSKLDKRPDLSFLRDFQDPGSEYNLN